MTTTDGGHDALTNSRFQVVKNLGPVPIRCNICGKVDVPVVSLGLRVDYVGAILFCLECMRQAGEAIGMVPRDVYDESMDHLETALDAVSGERDGLLRRIKDQNIGDDLDTRIRAGVIAGLTDDSVLAILKEHLAPVGEPVKEPVVVPDDDEPIFKL